MTDPDQFILNLLDLIHKLGVPEEILRPVRDYVAGDEDGHEQVGNDPEATA